MEGERHRFLCAMLLNQAIHDILRHESVSEQPAEFYLALRHMTDGCKAKAAASAFATATDSVLGINPDDLREKIPPDILGIIPRIEDSLQEKCKLLCSFVIPDIDAGSMQPTRLPQTMQAMKEKVHGQRALLSAEQATLVAVEQEYIRIKTRCLLSLTTLFKAKKVQRLADDASEAEFQKQYCVTVQSKLMSGIKGVAADTYTKSTVPALATVQSILATKQRRMKERNQELKRTLGTYSTDSLARAAEYRLLLQKIDECKRHIAFMQQ